MTFINLLLLILYYLLQTIDYSSPRGGISVETNTSGNTPTSYLLIDAVAPSDSGKYSCHPANAQEISVNVQVQEGENSFFFPLLTLKILASQNTYKTDLCDCFSIVSVDVL